MIELSLTMYIYSNKQSFSGTYTVVRTYVYRPIQFVVSKVEVANIESRSSSNKSSCLLLHFMIREVLVLIFLVITLYFPNSSWYNIRLSSNSYTHFEPGWS